MPAPIYTQYPTTEKGTRKNKANSSYVAMRSWHIKVLTKRFRGCSLRDSGDVAYAAEIFDRPCTRPDVLIRCWTTLVLKFCGSFSGDLSSVRRAMPLVHDPGDGHDRLSSLEGILFNSPTNLRLKTARKYRNADFQLFLKRAIRGPG